MRVDLLVESTVALVAAYVSRNVLAVMELPTLIGGVHAALADTCIGRVIGGPPSARATDAQIAASLGHDHCVSLINGKPYRSLKLHLAAHGPTPERYRVRYGLSAGYPMVSPGYAAVRSRIARRTQFGRKVA